MQPIAHYDHPRDQLRVRDFLLVFHVMIVMGLLAVRSIHVLFLVVHARRGHQRMMMMMMMVVVMMVMMFVCEQIFRPDFLNSQIKLN